MEAMQDAAAPESSIPSRTEVWELFPGQPWVIGSKLFFAAYRFLV